VNPDAVRDGECGPSRYGCIRRDRDRQKGRAVLGVNFGRPIISNGDFATRLFPDYFAQDLFRYACKQTLDRHTDRQT